MQEFLACAPTFLYFYRYRFTAVIVRTLADTLVAKVGVIVAAALAQAILIAVASIVP